MALSACGTIVSETFENVGEPIDSPSAASTASADVDATLTLETGIIADGPGISVSDAIANATGEPNLVNGVVLLDNDGVIWLCEALTDTSPPACDEARLRVPNYPVGTADWDISTGELIGLQEEGGVLWREGAQYYGVVEP